MAGAFYSFLSDGTSHPTLNTLITNVCDRIGFTKDEVLGHGRRREVVDLRHLLMAIAYHEFNLSVVTVGTIFNKDHTTICHAKKKVFDLISTGIWENDAHLERCLHVAEEEFYNQYGDTFKILSKWLTTKK